MVKRPFTPFLGTGALLLTLGTAWAAWNGDALMDVLVTNDPISMFSGTDVTETLMPPIVNGNGGDFLIAVPTPYMTLQRLDARGDRLLGDAGTRNSQSLAGVPRDIDGVTDGQGGLISAWSVSYPLGQGFDLFAQRFDASGNPLWGDGGTRLSGAAGDQFLPLTAEDGSGGGIVAWEDPRNAGDIYAQRVNSLGQPLWTTDGVAVVTSPNAQRLRALASGGGGESVLVWRDSPALATLNAQRLDPQGQTRWVTPLGPSTSNPAVLAIPDGQGGTIVSWPDAGGLRAQRLDASGVILWAAGGIAVSPAFVTASDHMTSDGAGGAVLTWNYRSDIYAQRIDATGALRWLGSGVPVCTNPSIQVFSRVVGTGDGGVVIGWQDARAFPLRSIFAQRLDSNGQALWSADGIPFVQANQNLRWGRAVGDGEGGMTGSYVKGNAFPFFAFANHLSPSGELGLPSWYSRYGFGSGSFPSRIRVARTARAGLPFPLSGAGGQPSRTGWLIVGLGQDLPGTLMRGVRIHVNLNRPYRMIPVASNEAGGVVVFLPLPSGTAGRTFYAQFVWTGGGGVSASDALAVTVQP